MLRTLLPDDADVAGLLALILLTDARRATRLGDDGQLVLLADQDRSQWDRGGDRRGHRAGARGAAAPAAGPVRARWPPSPPCTPRRRPGTATDWGEIVGLYDLLVAIWPSPVVALNRAVAVGFAEGPSAGLDGARRARPPSRCWPTYSYLASARADFLRRLGRTDEAGADAYEEALLLTENAVERAFLADRLGQVDI